MLPNVIIGGTQKSGTTSLFRYLADHPSVCPSSIKEVDFFLKYNDEIDMDAVKEYESFFSRCSSNQPIRLEASPLYLKQSALVARRMHMILPDAKLIFILREPVSVLLSYIIFKSGISRETYPLESFISLIREKDIRASKPNGGANIKNILGRLQAGCYVSILKEYFDYYAKDKIGVFFYDELSKDTHSFILKVCKFINIDGRFYNNYQFKVENKTRAYKYPRFHLFAFKMNMKFEVFFNRHSLIRNLIRSTYHSFCEAQESGPETDESDIRQLERFYEPYNRELCSLLKQKYPDLILPYWLDKGDK